MQASLLYHVGNLLFNVQSEAFETRAASPPLTLLSHAQSGVERRLGSRSARGCATELGLFLLPWHRRLAPSSICSFGTYSCNDYKQSLIKLQRTLPRNPCVSVYGDDRVGLLIQSFSLQMCVTYDQTACCCTCECICVVNWCISRQQLLALFPLCHAQTAQSIHGLKRHHKNVHDRLHHHVMQLLHHGMDYVDVVEVLIFQWIDEGMDDAAWTYVFPISSVTYFTHKENPYDGQLGYKSHNNTAAPKTIIWIS